MTKSPRYLFLDAVRGLTALAVLLFHVLASDPMGAALYTGSIAPLTNNFELLTWRVPVFFVLSGFVIALTLRNGAVNRGRSGNFLLRRLVRLLPLYWVVLLLMIGLQWGERFVPGLTPEPLPSAGTIALNFLLLQNIFHVPSLIFLAWTLCLEMQFYLLYLGILMLANLTSRHLNRARQESWLTNAQNALLFVSALVSLGVAVGWPSETEDASVFHYWFYFVAGVFSFRAFYGRTSLRVLGALCLCVVAATGAFWWAWPQRIGAAWVPMLSAAWVSLLFYYIGRAGLLESWLSWKPLQTLGRISYSLYLIHFVVLAWVFRLGTKISGSGQNSAAAWAGVAIAVSFAAAFVLYRWIEEPSMRWSASLKPKALAQRPLPKADSAADFPILESSEVPAGQTSLG